MSPASLLAHAAGWFLLAYVGWLIAITILQGLTP